MIESMLYIHTLGALNIKAIRNACIEACMNAMIEERRFMYTDQFVRR